MFNRTNQSPKRPNCVTKCNTRAAAKEVIITTIDKGDALLELGEWPTDLLLAKGQRLPAKGKKKKKEEKERQNRRKTRENCVTQSTQWDQKEESRIIYVAQTIIF